MPRHVVLLRGVNLGSRNRVAMPALRDALAGAGFEDVQSYLQSGNVVLSSKRSPTQVARECEKVIVGAFGLDITVIVRTRAELSKVVARNPLDAVATNPKRYQVSFLARRLGREARRKVEEAAVPPEQVVVDGREIYAWHPETIARSRLWALLAGRDLGVAATARNWTTVTKLLELAQA